MSSPNEDWYAHLVAQSRTDDIYTLIHQFLTPDWEPGHNLDFVVVRLNDLPDKLKPIPPQHLSQKLKPAQYCFPRNDFVLLHNDKLTDYLHHAKWAKTIEDFEERSFIQLCYQWTGEAEYVWHHPPAYPFSQQPGQPQPPSERIPVTSNDYPLFMAYEFLQSGISREQALEFARQGQSFLDAQQTTIHANADESLSLQTRRLIGYNIVAMVYAWNNLINEAATIDALYIHHADLWPRLDAQLRPYLEMLMAKNQQEYLGQLFADNAFRNYFIAHYEAFVSLFINPDYQLTCAGEVVGIVNRVRNTRASYK